MYTDIMLNDDTGYKTELVRIDSKVLGSLRKYCLNKYGKVYGMITVEASKAIKDHIEQNPIK